MLFTYNGHIEKYGYNDKDGRSNYNYRLSVLPTPGTAKTAESIKVHGQIFKNVWIYMTFGKNDLCATWRDISG